MSNKLVERYNEIEVDLAAVREVAASADADAFQAKLAELDAKQADLKETLLRLIALSHLRDNAWRTLSHGSQT